MHNYKYIFVYVRGGLMYQEIWMDKHDKERTK